MDPFKLKRAFLILSVDGGLGDKAWGGNEKDEVKSKWHLVALITIEGLRRKINLPREVGGNFSYFALGLKYWAVSCVLICRKPLEIRF